MIEQYLRPFVQPVFNALGRYAVQNSITPNMITQAAFFTGIAAAAAVALGFNYISLVCLVFSGLCDALDGTVARLTKQQSAFGAYMDLISDRMVEALMILGFSLAYPANNFAYLLFLAAVLLHFSTFIAAGALFPNEGHKSIHYDHSIVERSEAIVVFCIMLIIPSIIFYLLMAFNCVIIASGYNRYRRVKAFCLSK